MILRWRSVAAGVALVLAGCSSGGGGTEELLPPPGGGTVADIATARTLLLAQADLPPGWRAPAHTETPEERARSRQIAMCIGRPDPESTRSAIAYGPDLNLETTQVSSIATVLKTVEDAQADLAAIRSPEYGECVMATFEEDIQRQVPEATVQDTTFEPLPVEAFGDASVGVRLTASLVYPDRTDRIFADLVYITKDRRTVSVTFFSFNQPFPPTLEQSLVSRVGHRIATA